MKQTIWKFSTLNGIEFLEIFKIEMPKDSEILCVQIDQKTNIPCIWALVYPDNEKENRYFQLFGTGHLMINHDAINRQYIGTYQYQKGKFVGHLFERLINP